MTATLRELQLYGISPDLPGSKNVNGWTDARNMLCREVMERVTGNQPVLGTPLFPPEWLLQTRNPLEAVIWCYAGEQGIGIAEGENHTDATPAGWVYPARQSPITGGVLNSIPVISADLPWYWDGAGPFQALPDWPATRTCRAMRPYKFQLIAMTIDEGGTLLEDMVYWSDVASPGQIPQEWTPNPDNQAGFAELSATRGSVIDGAPLRDLFIIWKESSCYTLQYTGGSQIMALRLLDASVGLLNRNCLANVGGLQFALTQGDVVVTDGQQVRSIADDRVQRSLFAGIEPESGRRSFLVADEAAGELIVAVPETGQDYPSVGWVYDLGSQQWGQRDFSPAVRHGQTGAFRFTGDAVTYANVGTTYDTETRRYSDLAVPRVDFEQVVVCTADGFEALDINSSEADPDLSSSLRRDGLEIAPGRIVTLRRIWLEVDAPQGTRIDVKVGAVEYAGQINVSPASSDVASFIVGEREKVDLSATGRWFNIELINPVGAGVRWRLVSMTLEYRVRGRTL